MIRPNWPRLHRPKLKSLSPTAGYGMKSGSLWKRFPLHSVEIKYIFQSLGLKNKRRKKWTSKYWDRVAANANKLKK